MKKRYLIIGSLAFFSYFQLRGQQKDSTDFKVDKLDIEFVYNHYIQDGSNSAVTGGIGTEELTVYGPSIKLKKKFNKTTWSYQLGTDLVSSASTDKIDAIPSSASSHDFRTYTNLSFERSNERGDFTYNAGVGASIESDYFSFSQSVGFSKLSANKMRTYSAQLQLFQDDLRWREEPLNPAGLIYPRELRSTEWFGIHNRYSYNLNLGFQQILGERDAIGLFGVFSLQEGLLSTPFHRIFFDDGTRAVENFPRTRRKAALSLFWSRFIGGNVILKNSVTGYADNFGIQGYTFQNETAVKLGPKFTISPNFRVYIQDGAGFFKPHGDHIPTETYYTSDYDLSDFEAYQFGSGFAFKPGKSISKGMILDAVQFRYQYYHRSNELNAHIMSLAINITVVERKNKK